MNKHCHSALLISLSAAALTSAVHAGDASKDVWPKPQMVTNQQQQINAVDIAPKSVAKFPVLVESFKKSKLHPSGKVAIQTLTGDTAKAFFATLKVKEVQGAYAIQISNSKIKIAALDQAGVFYATQTLAQMIETDGKIQTGKIADWPDVAVRGTVEGFYGKPWEHPRRLSQIEFYGKYKMNAYMYGPKDDPYSGFNSHKWRDEYPANQAKQITELVEASKANHVNFIWALHPGSSIRWDDKNNDGIADDTIAAMKKLEAMYALGVRSYAIFFDDIGGEGAKAKMQVKMLNYINREFIKKKKDVTPLIMCPTSYSGTHGGDYKKQLGANLDKDIDIMWTGPGICSDIPAKAVNEVSKHWQRKPFIWWNWPVNDYCRYNLLMGRTYGLDKGNQGKLSGFVSNPMDKPEASKLGLFSIADWSWNIDDFDSQKSWEAAFPRLYGKLAKPMYVFAKHNSDQGKNYHRYQREESVAIKPTVDKALKHYRSSNLLDAGDSIALMKEFTEIELAAKTLIQRMPQADPVLWHEIEYWVKSYQQLGAAGKAAVRSASKNHSDKEAQMALFSTIVRAKALQQVFSESQKKRHFEETFASDKRWAKGCKVSTLVMTPFIDKLYASEWKKFYQSLGGIMADQKAAYSAFSNVEKLKNLQVERSGKFVKLARILEVIELKPNKHLGLSLPSGVYATYIHTIFDNPEVADRCIIEVSKDGKMWKKFNSRNTIGANKGELQNRVNGNDKIRHFRLVNTSDKSVSFKIKQFKFDVPADAKTKSLAATTDGDPASYFTVSKKHTFTGPANAKKAYVLTDAPKGAVHQNGNKVTIDPSSLGSAKVFEIIWK